MLFYSVEAERVQPRKAAKDRWRENTHRSADLLQVSWFLACQATERRSSPGATLRLGRGETNGQQAFPYLASSDWHGLAHLQFRCD